MDGIIPAFGYLGTVITAIATLKAVGRFRANSTDASVVLPNNRADIETMIRLAKHLYREERVVLLLFVLTSLGLVAKYFTAWTSPPGYFLEVINLFCAVNVWIHFRTTNLSSNTV